MDVWTIVVAGGSGSRFGGRKQFATLGTPPRTLLRHCVDVAQEVSKRVIVVVPSDAIAETEMDIGAQAEVTVVAGGPTRSASVRAGLDAVPETAAVVAVHDGARPLASVDLYQAVLARIADGADGAIPVVPLTDSIRTVDGQPVDRASLVAVQTPQAFGVAVLRRAHGAGGDSTDDASLVTECGGQVVHVAGELSNIKVTEPRDLAIAEQLLAANAQVGAR